MWLFELGIIVLVVGIRVILHQDYLGNALLVGGWILGYVLAEADDWFYVAVCNPQELSCQRIRHEVSVRNWRNAWGLLKSTTGERQKLPIHNVVTAAVVTAAGVWLVTSGGNTLAQGLVIGLEIRLFLDLMSDANFGRWYWVFSRQFSPTENKTIKILWGILLSIQLLFLVRG